MKKLILIACVGSFSLMSCAQKNNDKIPATVKSAFAKKYPAVKKAKWDVEDKNFEVGFEENEVDISILYDAQGNEKEVEKEINMKDLPQAMKDYIAKNYSGAKMQETAKITDDKGVSTYEVEIKGKDLLFDLNGNFIK